MVIRYDVAIKNKNARAGRRKERTEYQWRWLFHERNICNRAISLSHAALMCRLRAYGILFHHTVVTLLKEKEQQDEAEDSNPDMEELSDRGNEDSNSDTMSRMKGKRLQLKFA